MGLDTAPERQPRVDSLEDALVQAARDGVPSPAMTALREMVRGR